MAYIAFRFHRSVKTVQEESYDYGTVEAAVDENGEVLETSMDDIEISIVQAYWEKNKQFAED